MILIYIFDIKSIFVVFKLVYFYIKIIISADLFINEILHAINYLMIYIYITSIAKIDCFR